MPHVVNYYHTNVQYQNQNYLLTHLSEVSWTKLTSQHLSKFHVSYSLINGWCYDGKTSKLNNKPTISRKQKVRCVTPL